MTIHRFIPATEKHGPKTACGIGLDALTIEPPLDGDLMRANDGGMIRVAHKGHVFDCKRCKAAIDNFLRGRIAA